MLSPSSDFCTRTAAVDALSERERVILELMASGLNNSSICGQLWLSPKTVETHVTKIFHKLGLAQGSGEHRRVAAVLAYLSALGQNAR